MTLEAAAASTSYGTSASGSSFYAAMRILPREQREAMFQIYSFCRQVDDIAGRASTMARRYRRAVSGRSATAAARLCRVGSAV
jgi:phytoene/squalene synthetase